MKRGEIWTLRDRQYASKARPVVIIQNDAFDIFDSVILCLFTSFDSSQIVSDAHKLARQSNKEVR